MYKDGEVKDKAVILSLLLLKHPKESTPELTSQST